MPNRDLISPALSERASRLPEGWRMVEMPSASLLPPDLARYEPDAVALGPGGGIVFEVIVGRRQAASDQKLKLIQSMRAMVKSLPGWDFELIVIPEPEPPLESEQSISRQLEAALQVAQVSPSAAFVYAFVALEWKLAQWSKSADLPYEPNAVRMASRLVSEGILSEADYAKVREYQRSRNEFAHAARRSIELDYDSVHELIEFTKGLDARITEFSGLSQD